MDTPDGINFMSLLGDFTTLRLTGLTPLCQPRPLPCPGRNLRKCAREFRRIEPSVQIRQGDRCGCAEVE